MEKQQGSMKYLLKYGRQDNVTTYCSNPVMLDMIKTLYADGWRDASSPSLKRVTSD